MAESQTHSNDSQAGPGAVEVSAAGELDLQTLRQAIAQSAEAVCITDPEGRIQYVNAAFETISGYTTAEVLGRRPNILKSGRHAPEFYQRMWETLNQGRIWRGRFTNRRKDGSIYEEEGSISPVFDPAGRVIHFVAVKRDITRELRYEEQFRQSQKMEAVGRLAGSLAHDFNNMLTAISGFASMAQDSLPPDRAERNDLAQILTATRRATELTRKLLTFSRRQVAQPRPVLLNEILADMRPMVRSVLAPNQELLVHPARDLGWVTLDPEQITQAVLALVLNAKDAMPRGGTLVLETENVIVSPEACDDLPELAGPAVRLTVRDTGCGMGEDVKRHLFEPFFTTKLNGKGLGLGLATVYGIIRQGRGAVRITSEPSRGTTVDIYLPRVEPVRKDLPAELVTAGTFQLEAPEPGIILFAEDEPSLLELGSRILQGQGYQVLTAANGVEALTLLNAHRGRIDLLLTDVIMPQMGGLELAVEVRMLQPDTPVIFMSAYTDELFIESEDLRQGTIFIQKPYTPKILLQKVAEAIHPSPAKPEPRL